MIHEGRWKKVKCLWNTLFCFFLLSIWNSWKEQPKKNEKKKKLKNNFLQFQVFDFLLSFSLLFRAAHTMSWNYSKFVRTVLTAWNNDRINDNRSKWRKCRQFFFFTLILGSKHSCTTYTASTPRFKIYLVEKNLFEKKRNRVANDLMAFTVEWIWIACAPQIPVRVAPVHKLGNKIFNVKIKNKNKFNLVLCLGLFQFYITFKRNHIYVDLFFWIYFFLSSNEKTYLRRILT